MIVGFSCKPSQPLFIYVQSHRTRSTKQNVHPKIKLQVVDEEGSRNVLLNHVMLPILNLVSFKGEEDAPALAIGFGFDYEALVLALLNLLPKLGVLIGEEPSFREEIVL